MTEGSGVNMHIYIFKSYFLNDHSEMPASVNFCAKEFIL